MVKKIFLIVFILSAAALAATFFFFKDFTVEISEAQAQAAIDNEIAKGRMERVGIELSLEKATIDFQSTNKAHIDMQGELTGYGFGGGFTGRGETGLRYKAPRIYLSKLDFKSIELNETDEGELQTTKDAVTNFLDRQKQKLEDKGREKALDTLLKTESRTLIKESIEAVIMFIPVYNLNNAGPKGSLAALALSDVTFTNDTAIVTLSPRTGVIRFLQVLFTALIVISLLFDGLIPKLIIRSLFGSKKEADS